MPDRLSARGERRTGEPTTVSVTCGGHTFTGASISAHTTFVFSRALNVIFDVGSFVEEMLPIDHVLITHGHQDHLLGLTRYVGLRRLQHMRPPTVFVPAQIENGVRRLFEVWQELEADGLRKPPEMNLVPVEAGQEARLSGEFVARAFPVEHTLPSLGYTIIQRRHKLKREYLGRPGHELAELKARDVQITTALDTPLVTYIGDASPAALDTVPDLGASRVVIIECTFLTDEHHPLAEERGHLHIRHLVERLDRFGQAELILTHFSRRYRRRDVKRLVKRAWPESQMHRVHLLV